MFPATKASQRIWARFATTSSTGASATVAQATIVSATPASNNLANPFTTTTTSLQKKAANPRAAIPTTFLANLKNLRAMLGSTFRPVKLTLGTASHPDVVFGHLLRKSHNVLACCVARTSDSVATTIKNHSLILDFNMDNRSANQLAYEIELRYLMTEL
jgi:hypothetical protein